MMKLLQKVIKDFANGNEPDKSQIDKVDIPAGITGRMLTPTIILKVVREGQYM